VETYPKNKAVNEIEELLLDSYVNSQNFDAALGLLDKFSSSDFDEAKQIVSYLKANSLYKSGQFASAIEYYTAAINPLIIANATYWKAQASYELKEYALALELFQEAKRFPKFSSLPFAKEIDHKGYCYFQLKNYPAAIDAFEAFLKQAQTVKYERDA